MNAFREKLKSGKRMLGTHINLSDHRVAEIMGSLGFDYLWIDMEHVSTSFKEMEIHLIGAKAAGTPTLVRVPWNDIPDVKPVLEAGPDAVLFPMIHTVEDAKKAIDSCIYPPEGKRGLGPCRAIRYGMESLEDYTSKTSKELVRLLQVESREAVMAMEEIARIPYVDGFIIGPMDLSGSVGELTHIKTGETIRLIDQAIEKAHASGLPIGISIGLCCSREELEFWMSRDLDMISIGTDISCIVTESQRLLSTMREVDSEVRGSRCR